MERFYGVLIEFYDRCEPKACVTERRAKEKPRNQYRRKYGMAAFKIWTASEKNAAELARLVKSGVADFDEVFAFYCDVKEPEAAA